MAQRFDASYRADLEKHYGRTYDLMIHFGFRAFELAQTGGIVSMIFNDSIFTSSDAIAFRRFLLPEGASTIHLSSVVRTRCFEGKAVNGGVVVAVEAPPEDRVIRYVENHGRPPDELTGASLTVTTGESPHPVGRSELWVVERTQYTRLPHRPLFRPSPEALALLDRFEECAAWSEFGRISPNGGADWELFSETRALERWKEGQRKAGFFNRLREHRFVLLGLVIEGGQGLATADDRRFLAAIEGTSGAEKAVRNRARLEELVLERPDAARLYRQRREAGRAVDDALLDVAARFRDQQLGWPRIGLVRVAPVGAVMTGPISDTEIEKGIGGDAFYVPFEKGDDSVAGGGATWRRENPLVIDWSEDSVALLRGRARQSRSYRKPRLQSEHLWGKGGITWNRVASYFRVRLVPEGAIFGSEAPTVRPMVDWLSVEALLALLNAPALDFAARALLSSRMHVEIGDIRRLPIPVLSDEEGQRLTSLGSRALAAKAASDRCESGESLTAVEVELDELVRELYGISESADLWVVR